MTAIGACVQAYILWKQHQQEENKQVQEIANVINNAINNYPIYIPTTPQPESDNLASEVGADYTRRRNHLVLKNWQTANEETEWIMFWVARAEYQGWFKIG